MNNRFLFIYWPDKIIIFSSCWLWIWVWLLVLFGRLLKTTSWMPFKSVSIDWRTNFRRHTKCLTVGFFSFLHRLVLLLVWIQKLFVWFFNIHINIYADAIHCFSCFGSKYEEWTKRMISPLKSNSKMPKKWREWIGAWVCARHVHRLFRSIPLSDIRYRFQFTVTLLPCFAIAFFHSLNQFHYSFTVWLNFYPYMPYITFFEYFCHFPLFVSLKSNWIDAMKEKIL